MKRFSMSLAVLCITGCGSTGPGNENEPIVLGHAGMPVEVTVPYSIDRGNPFEIFIVHYGSSSCTSVEDTDVDSDGNVTTVNLRVDRVRERPCTADFARFTERVELVLSVPGHNEVRVPGRFGARDTVVVSPVFVR